MRLSRFLYVFQNFLLRVASHSILSRDSLFRGFLKDVSATLVLPFSTISCTFVAQVASRKLDLLLLLLLLLL